jgi:hypothetical protein
MTKTRDDGTTYDVAMYARIKGTKEAELISTDEYDVDAPTDEQREYAEELLGTKEIEFFEEEC